MPRTFLDCDNSLICTEIYENTLYVVVHVTYKFCNVPTCTKYNMVVVSPPSDIHPRLLLTKPIAAITVLQFKPIFLGELSSTLTFLFLSSPTLYQP